MSMVINNNVQGMNALRNMKIVTDQLAKSNEKLSSGFKINRAADDSAGLAISEKMKGQIVGLNRASQNTLDGISLFQTAEGALQEDSAMFLRIRELLVQAANDTLTGEDRQHIVTEVEELTDEINAIAGRTEFNGKKIFDGETRYFQVGANPNQGIEFKFGDIGMESLADDLKTFDNQMPASEIAGFIEDVDNGMNVLAKIRAEIGAMENRLEHTMRNLDVAAENLTASESRIRDTDMALEMANLKKRSILSQAGISMLAQANQTPQNILRLLG